MRAAENANKYIAFCKKVTAKGKSGFTDQLVSYVHEIFC